MDIERMGTAGFIGLLARLCCACLAITAMAWAYVVGPAAYSYQLSGLASIGHRLQIMDSFSPVYLREVEAEVQDRLSHWPCVPDELDALLLVRVRLTAPIFVDSVAAASRGEILERLKGTARQVLRCNPYSSTGWAVLSWAELLQNADPKRALPYFDMSYRTGPIELIGLIRRLELGTMMWEYLDDTHKELLWNHMRVLVDGGFYVVVAGFFNAMSGNAKAFMTEKFARFDELQQRALAMSIWLSDGDIDLPLVPPRGSRPWR